MGKEKMNIAMLGHKVVPSREGGIEVVVGELSTRMVQLGQKVTCYNRKRSRRANGNKKELKEYEGVTLKSVFTINRKGLAAVTSSLFSSICAAFGSYDIVHFHAEGPSFFLWIPKMFGKKCVVTIHGLDWQREKWGEGFGARFIKWGERMAAKHADEIIVLSQAVNDYFRKTYGCDAVYIPNGVNRPVVREAKQIIDDFDLQKDNYILFLGRIVPEKGIKNLIGAYNGLHTDKKLVIAGGSSDTNKYLSELKNMCADNPNIIFTGVVEGELLDELFSNAYVYVLPTELEGMPLSLMEAMSYGACCLVSDIPECTEIVDDKAVVFKKGDIEDLKEKLQMLCDDADQVQSYKKQSSDYICERYKWDTAVDETLELYQKALN